jgi:hypothetical protein
MKYTLTSHTHHAQIGVQHIIIAPASKHSGTILTQLTNTITYAIYRICKRDGAMVAQAARVLKDAGSNPALAEIYIEYRLNTGIPIQYLNDTYGVTYAV